MSALAYHTITLWKLLRTKSSLRLELVLTALTPSALYLWTCLKKISWALYQGGTISSISLNLSQRPFFHWENVQSQAKKSDFKSIFFNQLILVVLMLLCNHIERVSVSRMCDFFYQASSIPSFVSIVCVQFVPLSMLHPE